MERWHRSLPSTSSLLTVVIATAVLYLARPVLLPLAVAVLLSVVIAPAVKRLERVGLGRVRVGRLGSVLVLTIVIAGVFAGMGWVIAVQGGALAEKLPEYRRNVRAQLREPLDSLRRLERTAREVREMAEAPGGGAPEATKVEVVEGGSEVLGFARDWAGSVASLLGTAGLVIVLLIFLLIEREGLRDRVVRVVAPGDLRVTTSALADAVDRVTRYVRALALLNLGHGAVIALGLWLIGIPAALLLGLLSALLRFVPYLGPWLAAAISLFAALATAEGWTILLTVGAFLVTVELVSNNLVEPWVFGTSVGLSPFAHILSTIFWAWLWGPIGLVVATPLTACLVAFGRYAPSLEPLAILLSEREALPAPERLYQRVLAQDVYEATALVAERTEEADALSAWDEIVLPALGLLERDRQAQRLDAEQLEVAHEALELLLSELSEAAPDDAAVEVLCLPAQGGWDETVCAALARFLSGVGVPTRAIGHRLSAELAEEVARSGAKLVCISSLGAEPGAAQHLVLRIRKKHPDAKIVVGLWGQAVEDPRRYERLRADAGTYLVGRLADASERVRGSFAPA
jgi:predicted PurR-regulated permease PerM